MYMAYWPVDSEAHSVCFARAGGARKGHEVAFAELDQQFVLLSERLAESGAAHTLPHSCVHACVIKLPWRAAPTARSLHGV